MFLLKIIVFQNEKFLAGGNGIVTHFYYFNVCLNKKAAVYPSTSVFILFQFVLMEVNKDNLVSKIRSWKRKDF